MSMINADMSMAQAKGMLGSASFYERLAERESSSIGKMKNELSDLERHFKEAMDSGQIQEGSEEWYAMKQSILGVKEAIAQANVQLQEYSNTIREINWSYFDTAQERFSQMTQEANFLVNLLQNKKLFDDRGQFSGAGIGTLGMHTLNYDSHMAQAEAYGEEFWKVANEWNNDRSNQDLLKRRNELWQLQRESILAAEQEKDAVRSLVEEGIRIELDALRELIDTYKERLDAEKELYEYQKKVSEKSKNIAAIQKQLTAYENDKSEETRAKVQKLTQDLEKARTDLQETERDKSISEQKKLLDDVYSQYEELMNSRLDDVDKLMKEMIGVANARSGEIRSAIESAAASVGYTLSGGKPGQAGITTGMDSYAFFDKVFQGTAAAKAVLDKISENVLAMAKAAGAVKAYAKGGLVDYTGLAAVHGTPGNPEMVLSAADTEKFLQAAQMMQNMQSLTPVSPQELGMLLSGTGAFGSTMGDITMNVAIERVLDYNDFVTQLQNDPKFEKLIGTMTMGRMMGGSKMAKNGIRF